MFFQNESGLNAPCGAGCFLTWRFGGGTSLLF